MAEAKALFHVNPMYGRWRTYTSGLLELAACVSDAARSELPDVLRDPGLAIAYSDSGGRHLLRLTSLAKCDRVTLPSGQITCAPGDGFTMAPLFGEASVETFLFPPVGDDDSVSIWIDEPYVVLDGLGFSNRDFNEKYWAEATFYRNVAGNIPFSVGPRGSMLGLDLVHGFEDGGTPVFQLLEFVRLFGSAQLFPRDAAAVRDMAFVDLVAAMGGVKEPDWSFSDFLSTLADPVRRNVLLLGSFSDQGVFTRLKTMLAGLGYNGFTLLDAPDMSIQSSLEKFYTGLLCSMFVIVVDDSPSGHLQEMQELLAKRFRPVVVLRTTGSPSTWFSEDRIRRDEYFRVVESADVTTDVLLPAIRWARDLISKQIDALDRINRWRHSP